MTPEGAPLASVLAGLRMQDGRTRPARILKYDRTTALYAHFLLSPSQAMREEGQWRRLMKTMDSSAILSSAYNKHWRGLLREELRFLRCAKRADALRQCVRQHHAKQQPMTFVPRAPSRFFSNNSLSDDHASNVSPAFLRDRGRRNFQYVAINYPRVNENIVRAGLNYRF